MEGSEFEISELDELERIVGDPTAKAKRLSFSLLREMTDNFSEKCEVGRGGFGVVYKGFLPNRRAVAVRKMHRYQGLGGNEFENEVRTLMKVAHKNIVRFIGYCSYTDHKRVQYEGGLIFAESSQRLICMEYVPNGSLYEHFHGKLNTACPSIIRSHSFLFSFCIYICIRFRCLPEILAQTKRQGLSILTVQHFWGKSFFKGKL